MIFLLAFAVVSPEVNFLRLDLRTREVIERNWPDAETPVPVGSLVKPFVALAYSGEWPEFFCDGKHCWLRRGHGRLRFREALAQSCNAYFLNLARGVDSQMLGVMAAKFGMGAPSEDTVEARIGLGTGWKVSPLELTRAYGELVARAGEPRVNEILDGLRLAAETGTAKAIGH